MTKDVVEEMRKEIEDARDEGVSPEDLIRRAVSRLDELGREIPDPNPMAMPIGFERPETLAEQVQRLVRTSISQHAALHGGETFEESEDFDVDDEIDIRTPFEAEFDPVLGKDVTPEELSKYATVYRDRYIQAEKDYRRIQDMEIALASQPVPQRIPMPPTNPVIPGQGSEATSAAEPQESGAATEGQST